MAFKGKTTRAKNSVTDLVIAVWHEFAESSAAHRAFHIITPVQEAGKLHYCLAQAYQVTSGYQLKNKRKQLHATKVAILAIRLIRPWEQVNLFLYKKTIS